MNTETHQFQAEVRQLLDIVINALYSDREIFVRELVSNASDALEKLRLKQLTDSNIYQPEKPLEISITTDKENKTITIAVKYRVRHPLYGKIMNRTTKIKAHDENNECGIGDKVKVMETRPLSKDKRWRLVEIIEKAK